MGEKELFSIKGETVYTRKVSDCFFSFNTSLIYADSFLFVHNDTLFLFYEQQKYKQNGVLMMAKTKDLRNWSRPVVVLYEPFHLSFPFVFEHSGNVYMIPETGADKSIRLYKAANDQLTDFTYDRTLLSGQRFLDSSVLFKDEVFYLFSTEEYEPFKYRQRLFFSDNLTGTWREHPQSPIFQGNLHGRNAGSIITYNGKLYRPTQDCLTAYGKNVALLQIEEISPEYYSETEIIPQVIDTSNAYYKNGGHQFNFVEFKGHIVVATDAKWSGGKPNVGILVRRVINSLKSKLNVKD